jgi:hypothetical protein
MRAHRRQRLTGSRRLFVSTALAAIALLAACGCASERRCGPTDVFSDTFIAIENCRYLIPPGRSEVEAVLSVNGRELWRATVRNNAYRTNPGVDVVYAPRDLEQAARYTYVLEAGGAKYTLAGPDPLCRYVQIQCLVTGGEVKLRSPDYRPVYLE